MVASFSLKVPCWSINTTTLATKVAAPPRGGRDSSFELRFQNGGRSDHFRALLARKNQLFRVKEFPDMDLDH